MAQRCEICGKGPGFGHRVSHSDRKTKRRFMPNLQSIRIVVKGETVRAKVCTSCIKTNKVRRPA
ncbi:MAG TPA: 50S ribosomal protein L28 [Armatimonadetes bacterium]|nr:50S ribosomal protein L28 [Armatimonadota bacterium]